MVTNEEIDAMTVDISRAETVYAHLLLEYTNLSDKAMKGLGNVKYVDEGLFRFVLGKRFDSLLPKDFEAVEHYAESINRKRNDDKIMRL